MGTGSHGRQPMDQEIYMRGHMENYMAYMVYYGGPTTDQATPSTDMGDVTGGVTPRAKPARQFTFVLPGPDK